MLQQQQQLEQQQQVQPPDRFIRQPLFEDQTLAQGVLQPHTIPCENVSFCVGSPGAGEGLEQAGAGQSMWAPYRQGCALRGLPQ